MDLRDPLIEASETRPLRDGDIYSWRWRDDNRHADNAPYRSYHCKSQIAEVRKGRLYDTYWSPPDSALDPATVILTFRGNVFEMTRINQWKLPYYRAEDVVDTRHSNDSSAPIYLKAGALRDAETMRAHITYQRERALSAIRSAENTLKNLNVSEALIEKGALDEVCF